MANKVNAPAKVEILVHMTQKQRKSIAEISYDHGKDTFTEKDHIDWFVILCGIFALGCLAFSAYNVFMNGLDVIFGVLMGVYAIVAIFCFSKPIQISIQRGNWTKSLKRRIVFGKKNGGVVTFDDFAASFTNSRGKEKYYYYEKMWDAYETAEYFVFHVSDSCIIPVSKSVIVGMEQDGRCDLIDYFGNLVDRAAVRGGNEEDIPVIVK